MNGKFVAFDDLELKPWSPELIAVRRQAFLALAEAVLT